MNTKRAYLAVAAVALIALAGCGSVGDVLGTNNGSSPNNSSSVMHGTVDSVDVNGHSILLTNTSGGYNTMLSSGGSGNSVRVYYDNNTNVQYQGQNYRPEDLDRGDQVDVRVTESGNRLIADQLTVTYNASTASSTYPNNPNNGTYVSSISGTVRSIDTSRHQIEVDRGYGNTVWVDYSSNTPVTYNGRSYYPTDLERGDQIDIRVTDNGGGRYTANSVTVVRSISGGTSSSNSSYNSTIRGTVRYVDTAAHTIQLDQTSWISGFNGNTNGSVVTVQYDANAGVYVNGALQPLSGLERGDVVEVQVNGTSAGNLFANRITLVRDVRQ